MRIIIDGRLLSPFHGIGKYTIALIESLCNYKKASVSVLFNEEDQKNYVENNNVEWIKINAVPFSLYEQLEIPYKLKKIQYDIYHSPFFTAPLFVRNLILTIHDIIPAVYTKDFGFLKNLYFKLYVQILVIKSITVLTVSEYSKKEIIRFFLVKKDKVKRIYQYNFDDPKNIENASAPNIKNPYFIYVGNRKVYKNVNVIINSIIKLRKKGIEVDLVLVGDFKDYNQSFIYIKRNISKEELYGLYEHAVALIYPSLCEGFGLPLVEAMGKGTPIIASNKSCIPEIVGDAGILIEPVEKEFTETMELVLLDKHLQKELGEKSFKRQTAFSYNKFKEELYNVYNKLQEELDKSRNSL